MYIKVYVNTGVYILCIMLMLGYFDSFSQVNLSIHEKMFYKFNMFHTCCYLYIILLISSPCFTMIKLAILCIHGHVRISHYLPVLCILYMYNTALCQGRIHIHPYWCTYCWCCYLLFYYFAHTRRYTGLLMITLPKILLCIIDTVEWDTRSNLSHNWFYLVKLDPVLH